MEKVSIIVPVYNAAPYLEQCTDSILAQSFGDFKLFLIDDGSTDGSGQICEQYQKKDDRVFVYHQLNRGAGSARNKGMTFAKGKYVMFVDPDDWIEPNLLQEMYEKAEKEDVDLVLWSLRTMIYDMQGGLINRVEVKAEEKVWETKEACEKGFITIAKWNDLLLGVPWNKFYKREIIEKYHLCFPNLRRRQDIIFNLDYYQHITSISMTSQIYSNYRVIDKGYEYKVSRDYADIALHVYRRYKALLTSWDKYKNENKQFIEYYFLTDILRITRYCMNPGWKWTLRERYQYIDEIMRKDEIRQVAKEFEADRKRKDLHYRLNKMKIGWLKGKHVLLMLITSYLEKLYQDLKYHQRLRRKVGGKS